METRFPPVHATQPLQLATRQPASSAGPTGDPLDLVVTSSTPTSERTEPRAPGPERVPASNAPLVVPMETPPRGRPAGVVLESSSHLAHPQLLPILAAHLDAGRPVLVTGATASGKCALVQKLASQQAGGCTRLACASDLEWGCLAPSSRGQLAWKDDTLARALSSPGLVQLDELHLLSPALQTQLAQLLSTGEVAIENRPETLKLHPETRFAATLHKGERLQDGLAEVLGLRQLPVEVQRMLDTASQVAAWARQEGRPLPLSPLDCQTARRSSAPVSQVDEARVDLEFLHELHRANDDLAPSDLNRALGADPDPVRDQIRSWKDDPPPWLTGLTALWPGYRELEHGLWRLAQTAPEHGALFARLAEAHEGHVEKSVASLTRVLASEKKPEKALESELRALAGIPEPTPGASGLRMGSGGLTVGGTFLRLRSRS